MSPWGASRGISWLRDPVGASTPTPTPPLVISHRLLPSHPASQDLEELQKCGTRADLVAKLKQKREVRCAVCSVQDLVARSPALVTPT